MPSDEPSLDVGDYLGTLRRRWPVVVLLVLVTVGASLAWSLTATPVYVATASLAVEPFRPAEDASLEEVILGDVTVNTERRVLVSQPVSEAVIDQVGLDEEPDELLDRVTVSVVPDTRVLEIRVVDTDAEGAADTANAFTRSYLDFRREQAVASLAAAQETLAEQRRRLRSQLDDVEEDLADAEGSSADGAGRRALQAERERLLGQLGQLAGQVAQAEADAQLLKGGGQVLQPAEVPTEPVSPKPVRNGLLAGVLGLFLGVSAAVIREHVDDLVRDEEDARRAGAGIPILGRIPTGEGDDARLVTLVDPRAPEAEAYRGLSASIRFLLAAQDRDDGDGSEAGADGRALLVTSPDPGDGKTSTAANLAVAAAGAGLRVVLVGTDMRRPKLHRRFGMPPGAGLSDVLVARVAVRDALVDVGVDGLWLLTAGTTPPNPAELLSSRRMRELVDFLRRAADLVVFDAPPVLAVADPLEVAPHADCTVLVLRANRSRRRTLHHAVERLAGVGVTVAGIVVNGLDEKSAAYAYYTQDHGTEEDPEAASTARVPTGVRTFAGTPSRGSNGNGRPPSDEFADPGQLFPAGGGRG